MGSAETSGPVRKVHPEKSEIVPRVNSVLDPRPMSLDLSAVGFQTEPFFFEYDWKVPVLYGLGIGARRDELKFLYEGLGPEVYPTFAVVPAYPALVPLVEKAKADMRQVVHFSQVIRLKGTIPSAARLKTVAKLVGIYDLKRLSQVCFATETTLDGSSDVLFETEWTLVVRDTGGFGGPRPPKWPGPKVPDGASPDFEVSDSVGPEQALLYRLSGDLNPLHADPKFAEEVGFPEGPILHGLATYGYLGRALLQGALKGNPKRLRVLGVQFKKPVWPGDTFTTRGYSVDSGIIALHATTNRGEDAVATGWAEVSPE